MKVFPCACVGEVNRNRNYVKMKIVWKKSRKVKKKEMLKHVKAIRSIQNKIIRVYQVYIQFFFCNTTHNLIFFYAFKEHLFIR